MVRLCIHPDVNATFDFGGAGLVAAAREALTGRPRVLRLRSTKAGPKVAESLRELGAEVDDCILYENRALTYDRLPSFEAVFFASASSADAFGALWGADALAGKTVFTIGEPTVKGLTRMGVAPELVSPVATVEGSLLALAGLYVAKSLEALA
jgi:uroporphyrinogen-III synthase